jgi:lysophospholipase
MPVFMAPDGTSLVFDAYEAHDPRAALLFLPGWLDHAGRWAAVGRRFQHAGLSAYCLDLRGQGRSGGQRGHLSRFSQLLGDLHAFRRAVRQRVSKPHVLLGHGLGGLVVLRYLETQPADSPLAAVVSSPWLGIAPMRPSWKGFARRLLSDVWPTAPLRSRLEPTHLSRDPDVNAAYAADPLVGRVLTPGAWKEMLWAQRAVAAEGARIESPLLFLLAGEDRVSDPHHARAFADALKAPVEMQWYAEMYHEILQDPRAEEAVNDVLRFLAARGL